MGAVKTSVIFEDANISDMIKNEMHENDNQTQLNLYIFLKEESSIIGKVTVSNIVRGFFQSCFIGYKLDDSKINKGYITEALNKVIDIVFNELKLHRVEANIMPRNYRSIRVIEKLGFEYEGLSKNYLLINDKWEDHAHYVKLNRTIE